MSLSLLIKPASSSCNLACNYCFYADETKRRQVKNYGIMEYSTAENIIKKAVDHAQYSLSVLFQGGEPSLRGIEFFKKFVEIEKQYNNKGIKIFNSIQTNGMLIDYDWCEFFKKEYFLVGISIDGPASLHNKYRKNLKGEGSLKDVFKATKLMDKYGVKYNVLCLVSDDSADKVKLIYELFKQNGFYWQQYIPCISTEEKQYLSPQKYGKFLCRLFDLWEKDNSTIHIRQFENYMAMLMGFEPEECGMKGVCSKQLAIEADGSAYPCDFYILDQYCLGNFNDDSIADMEKQRLKLNFIGESATKHSDCQNCNYLQICRGACRRERDYKQGELGQNRLCQAYKMFFDYALKRLYNIAKQR